MLENNHPHLSLSDYLELVKFRLSTAITFSTVTGYLISERLPGPDFALLVPGIFMLTCGSAALNQHTEKVQDSKMNRTKDRPVTTNKILAGSAIAISAFLIIAGSLLLLLTGFMPFLLGCSGVFLYNLVYTVMKKITSLAIIPGAIVGSVPPMIGYASSGATEINNKIVFFAFFMFLWQIPHFLLLLLRYGKEYQDARFKTFYDHLNEHQMKILTSAWIVLSSLSFVVFTTIREVFGCCFTWVFLILTVLLISLILISLKRIEYQVNIKFPFLFLNIYSFFTMLCLITDSLINALKAI